MTKTEHWSSEITLRSGGASAPAGVASPGDAGALNGLRHFKQRRLPDFDYTGRHAYHLVTVTTNREPLLVSDAATSVASALREAATATDFELLTFVVMPDHVHVLAQGAADDAKAIRFMQRFKQLAGFRYKQRHGGTLWQHSFYDRVLRRDEDPLLVARYILGNPVRAGLITVDGVWPYQGGTMFEGAGKDEGREANRRSTGVAAPPLRGRGIAAEAKSPEA